MSDNGYLMKSAGYDPDRPWDKEEALFAEAKRDMARIQAEDRGMIFDENGEMVGEADDGSQLGDQTMEMDLHPIDEEGEGADEEVEGDAAREGEGEGEGEEGAEQEDLFLPGATSP
jgi:transcription factor TFIIIB component B''